MLGPIQLAGDRLIYTAIHHNKLDLEDTNITWSKIAKDIELSRDDLNSYSVVHPKKLIVSFVNEGHAVAEARKIQPLLARFFVDHEISFVFSSIDHSPFDRPYRCLPQSMIDHRSWLSNLLSQEPDWHRVLLDRKFLCLNRRANQVRERLVWRLMSDLKPYSVRISLGCSSPHYSGPGIWIKEPITIDGVVDDQQKCQVEDRKFLSCLFNIVSESSDQSDVNTWSSVFLTEKTWKPLAMMQIPLWMAVPGTVAAVREQGFDVFDDICDYHRYDQINDENQRQDHLVALARKLDQKYSILCCRRLRRDLYDRLDNNRRRTVQLMQQQSHTYLKTINSL